jgi:NADP-dependent aldehyde dehydrogenase
VKKMTITTTNPLTGVVTPTSLEPSTAAEVLHLTELAALALPKLAALGRSWRSDLLEKIADAIQGHSDQLVEAAASETGLSEVRLQGEVLRSSYQFRLFAEALREGSFLEAAIDFAGETPLGPQPDIRRILVPVGPVAVFGSSNFPFAFSVLGGDVASSLAAGSPTVVKAHPSHPLTSQVSAEVLTEALKVAAAPTGTFDIVYGQDAGIALVQSPAMSAIGFTGSLGAANVLQAATASRENPIPFYGELSSVNPFIVTEGAAATRPAEIANALFASFTLSGGQLCTKPGIAFVPNGPQGDYLVRKLTDITGESGAAVLLNSRIRDAYVAIEQRLVAAGAALLANGKQAHNMSISVPPTLLLTDAASVGAELAEECFGPLLVIARYDSITTVCRALVRVPKSLTLTVQADETEEGLVGELFEKLQPFAGRLVHNGYPTGVRVSWAQTHGGPWPATNTQFTSVGVSSIRRWLRPVSWQNVPQHVLPTELRDGPCDVPRREDGVLILPRLMG